MVSSLSQQKMLVFVMNVKIIGFVIRVVEDTNIMSLDHFEDFLEMVLLLLLHFYLNVV